MAGMANGNGQHGGLVPAVDRAALILQAIAASELPLGVSELSRQLGLNKSTTYAILNTLCHHRLLERDGTAKTYRLGHALAELGQQAGERLDLLAAARPQMVALARTLQETVFLGTYEDGFVTIAAKEEAPQDVKITSPVGRRVPFSAAAFGKVFAAAMTEKELTQLLRDKPLVASTSKSLTKPSAYRAALSKVRSVGYALDDEEYLAGVRAAAAPVNDARGCVVAALLMVGFTTRIPRPRLLLLAQHVRRAAEQVSRVLGAAEYPTWNGIGD